MQHVQKAMKEFKLFERKIVLCREAGSHANCESLRCRSPAVTCSHLRAANITSRGLAASWRDVVAKLIALDLECAFQAASFSWRSNALGALYNAAIFHTIPKLQNVRARKCEGSFFFVLFNAARDRKFHFTYY